MGVIFRKVKTEIGGIDRFPVNPIITNKKLHISSCDVVWYI